jgi:hypothetical protein
VVLDLRRGRTDARARSLIGARAFAGALALAALLGACGGSAKVACTSADACPDFAAPSPTSVPGIGGADLESGGSTTSLGGEELAEVKEAAPPGLHITTIQISALSARARDALKNTLALTGFPQPGSGLISLPIGRLNPHLGMYYLIVPVVNEGPAPVRNLKARADFFDANGVLVWSETEALTHFPTRLGLNPPSLPNDRNAPAGELGLRTHNFQLYYFAGNVGLFTFAVPDTAVAKTVKTWELTFLVSTT